MNHQTSLSMLAVDEAADLDDLDPGRLRPNCGYLMRDIAGCTSSSAICPERRVQQQPRRMRYARCRGGWSGGSVIGGVVDGGCGSVIDGVIDGGRHYSAAGRCCR